MEVDPAHGVDVILVRTNIRKMKIMLEANLYLRYTEGIRIACNIHDVLAHTAGSPRGKPTTLACSTEIRSVLLVLDENAVAECILRLEGGKTL